MILSNTCCILFFTAVTVETTYIPPRDRPNSITIVLTIKRD